MQAPEHSLHSRRHENDLPEDLDKFAASEQGSFFSSRGWMRAVSTAFPRFKPIVFAVHDSQGAVQAVCPMFRTTQWGTHRYYSGALGTYGGLMARSSQAAKLLADEVIAQSTQFPVLLVRIHDFSGRTSKVLPESWSRHDEVCQVLDLHEDPEVMFRRSLTAKNRNKIRKARKIGLKVRRCHDRTALDQYYEIYLESARRWKQSTVLPRLLFQSLADHPGTDVWLAEHEGKTVAGLLNFQLGGQIMNWGNVSLQEAWKWAPNNLLHWEAIAAACVEGGTCHLYNFGSSAGLPGVETFKSAFGAREHRYSRIEYLSPWIRWIKRASK